MSEPRVPAGEPYFSLHKLQVFREVAERQSVTLAARALFVSQPVVSSHIRDLERFFAARLFNRSGRRMVLTEAGQTVLAFAQALAQQTERTRSQVRLQGGGQAGRVEMGASETPGSYRLPEWLGDFRLRHPRAEIAMEVLGADETLERLRQGRLDLAVVAPLEAPPGLPLELLYEEPLVVVCAPTHPLADSGPAAGAALARTPFITHADRPAEWLTWRLTPLGITAPEIALSLGSTEAIKLAARTGVGVVALFRCSVERELQRRELVEVELQVELPVRPIYLVRSQSRVLTPLQEQLVAYLRHRAKAVNPRPAPGPARLAGAGKDT